MKIKGEKSNFSHILVLNEVPSFSSPKTFVFLKHRMTLLVFYHNCLSLHIQEREKLTIPLNPSSPHNSGGRTMLTMSCVIAILT